jgi:hypothetical protein
MKQNVGTADRIVRAIAGLALIAWGIITQNWWGAIGLILLGTALLSWCPAYLPFGINSRK